MKNLPLPPNERERLDELRRYALLDTPPEKAFDDITQLAARIFSTPIAAVTLIDQDRQWFKSCVGLETREVGRNFAFCAYAILGTDVMVVPDARTDERFADNPLVTGPPFIRFYAGAPLRTWTGLNLGTLTISDTEPGQMTEQSIATLTSLAALVVSEMELRRERGEHRRVAESLRLLQAAVEQTRESIMITTSSVDLPGPEIVFVNPAFTEVTGYSSEEALGKTPRLLHGPKTDRAILNQIRAQMIAGVPFHGETVNYRKDGGSFIMALEICPIHDEQGRVAHFIAYQRDATEAHEVAAALRQAHREAECAREEAERANRAKSDFLSRMSHELRTPLHAILGYSQLLELEGLSVDDQESVAHILQAGNHLLGLINEVLDLARVESGNLKLGAEPMRVRETIEEALALIRPLAAERGVRLEAVTERLDYAILSDAQRFRQVMLNLLSNAVKFDRRGGRVTVTGEKLEDRLLIKVTDTGPGISPANLARLFVPFERLDVCDSVHEGTGLGLALSKHLIEALGGRIGVESVVGQGATFWVEVPLKAPAHGGNPILPSAPAAATEAAGMHTPRTVLYIEDDPSNLRLVERILARRPEVKLISATQGTSGLALAVAQAPDLILLDVHLPDLPGNEVLRRLSTQAQTDHIPVVVISADATKPQRERLLALGAQDYLTKPIDVRRFLALIDAVEPRSVPNPQRPLAE